MKETAKRMMIKMFSKNGTKNVEANTAKNESKWYMRVLSRCLVVAMLITTAFSGVAGDTLHANAASKWSKKTVTVKKGIYTFQAHLSKDKKSAWVYQVTSSKKNATNTLAFPAKIKGAKLTRIMTDTSKYDGEDEFVKNVFGEWVEPAHDCDGANAVSKKIAKITIPDTVEDIGYCSLSGLRSVKSITLPKSLKSLGGWALGGTESLTSLSIPANYTDDYFVYAFSFVKKLANISVDTANSAYCSENGNLYNKNMTELIWVAPATKDMVIPNKVKTIKSSAFYMSQAQSVKIPASVTKMEADCFDGGRHITSIDLDANNTVYKQDGNTIYKNSNKSLVVVIAKDKRAVISNQVILLTDSGNIVGECTRVDIPSSVTAVTDDWYDFMEYDSSSVYDELDVCYVEEIYLHMTTPPTAVDKKGKPYAKEDYELLHLASGVGFYYVPKESLELYKKWDSDGEYRLFYNGIEERNESYEYTKGTKYVEITKYIGTEKDVVVPEQIDGINVVSIGKNAFAKTAIDSVVIPDSVEEIGEKGFFKCENLKSSTLSKKCSVVGSQAFEGCKQLEEIAFGDGVTELGTDCFKNCEGLKKVIFGDNMTTIGYSCFKNCKSLTDVKLPKKLKKLDGDTFKGCKSLKTVTLNADLKSLSADEFYDCTSLTNIVIPKKIKYIYSGTFKNCKSLKSVTFKGTIKGFAQEAFANCKNLKSIKGKIVISKGIGSNAFKGCKKCKATFKVKKKSWKIAKSAFKGCKKIKLKYVK